VQFGLSQPQANYWIHHLLPVLRRAFADVGLLPERDGSEVAHAPAAHEGGSEKAIDGTERRRQRPKNPEKQADHNSGKKKAHPDKNILLVNAHSQKVVYLGAARAGKTHDKKAADAAEIAYPVCATLDQGTRFQGYAPEGVVTRQPKKKPRGKAWSGGETMLNRIVSSGREVVEHVIGGVKRRRIVKEVLRLTRAGVSDLVLEVACGLHNFRVSCRPLPTLDLLNLAGFG
jgi:hypothetical protein